MSQNLLPKVNTRKEYMEQLGEMMSHSSIEEDEDGRPGRKTELKTYIIEANGTLPDTIQTDRVLAGIQNTGIDTVKILSIKNKKYSSNFYLDKADPRFWLLHTRGLADEADNLVESLVSMHAYQLDSAWFSSGMLKEISKKIGNKFDGAGVDYETIFESEEDTDVPMEELKVSVFGFRAIDALRTMAQNESVKNFFAYKKVRIIRGDRTSFSKDDLVFNGRFSVKAGHSIDDHIALVENSKSLYKEQMQLIEGYSLGTKHNMDGNLIEGKPFVFRFERGITDWTKFLEVFLNSATPFRLWGLENKIHNNYFQVLAVDLHTGHPLDLEISNQMMRVYLPKGSCGNAVLRLFVNLQHYLDSRITCDEIPFDGGN